MAEETTTDLSGPIKVLSDQKQDLEGSLATTELDMAAAARRVEQCRADADRMRKQIGQIDNVIAILS